MGYKAWVSGVTVTGKATEIKVDGKTVTAATKWATLHIGADEDGKRETRVAIALEYDLSQQADDFVLALWRYDYAVVSVTFGDNITHEQRFFVDFRTGSEEHLGDGKWYVDVDLDGQGEHPTIDAFDQIRGEIW